MHPNPAFPARAASRRRLTIATLGLAAVVASGLVAARASAGIGVEGAAEAPADPGCRGRPDAAAARPRRRGPVPARRAAGDGHGRHRHRPDRPRAGHAGVPQHRRRVDGGELSLSPPGTTARSTRSRWSSASASSSATSSAAKKRAISTNTPRPKDGAPVWSRPSGANLFRTDVANVGPGETVLISIEYQAPVRQLGGEFALRLPLVAGPRYVAPGSLTDAAALADAAKVTAPLADPAMGRALNPVSITVHLRPGFVPANVISPYHRVNVAGTGNGERTVTLADGQAPADRDFELRWRSAGADPALGLFRQARGESST